MGKYNAYEKYQDSGVEWLGEIPEHWQSMTLRRFSQLNQGLQIAQSERFHEPDVDRVEYITIKSIHAGDNNTGKEYINNPSKRVICKKEDILLARTGATGEVITGVEGAFHNNFFKVNFDDLKINKEYYIYFLKTKLVKEYLLLRAGTTTIPDLNHNDFLSVVIGLPPLPEQQIIANFLDYKTKQIDALIVKKETLLEKLDEKRTAIISHAVTKGLDPNVPMKDSGIEWLGEIPEHWEVKRFKFLLSEPFKYGANEAAEINDPNLPRYIRITDVKDDGSLREDTFRSLPENIAKDYLLEEGDILLARSGATVGKTFIYSKSWGKAAYAGYLIRARVSGQNSSDFIYKFLQSKLYFDWVKSIFIQATIQNISAEKYSNLFITTPPLPEQQAIANFLDHKTKQIDQQKLKIQQAIDRLKEYRTALITNAVTGKIDVRQVSIP